MNEHPPAEVLGRFADGLLQPDDMATVAIHVAGCDSCRTRANREERSSSPYAGAIQRVARRSARREKRFEQARRRAPGDLAQILALPTEEWNRAVRSSPRYHSYAFARRALAASKASWTDDPYRAERAAELGLLVADRLSNAEHGRRNLNDLRSQAWAYIGNCRRIQGDLASVPAFLGTALDLHRRGSGSGRDRIQLISFMQSFLASSCRHEEVLELTDETDDLARHYRDAHSLGRSLWARARMESYWLRSDEALDTMIRAEELIEDRREPGSRTRIRVALAYELADLGYHREASSILASIASAAWSNLGRLDLVRYKWAESNVYWRMGNLESAASGFSQCRRALLAIGAPILLSDLDLLRAELHLEMGQKERAMTAASESFSISALRGLEADTLRALELLRQAQGDTT